MLLDCRLALIIDARSFFTLSKHCTLSDFPFPTLDLSSLADQSWPAGLRIAVVGRLGAMSRAQAIELIRHRGGQVIERGLSQVQIIVIGADSDSASSQRFDAATNTAIGSGAIEVLSETDFWHRLGLDHDQDRSTIVYTPRMLADLIEVPLRNVRRWIRLGLLQPVRVNHRLPYFNFEGLQNARRIQQWTLAGLSAESIVRQLRGLLDQASEEHGPNYDQLDIHLEGNTLLACVNNHWVDPSGQLRLNFAESTASVDEMPAEATISIASFQNLPASPVHDEGESMDQLTMLQMAEQAEDDGKLSEAVEWFRVMMARFGATADLHFSLAELLYRLGDINAARERYYAALEIDNEFLEARTNLGCVLMESNQLDLAIAAFQGVLAVNEAYPDVHYHLARALDDSQQSVLAEAHWRRFVELVPHSPWSIEARERLEASADLF